VLKRAGSEADRPRTTGPPWFRRLVRNHVGVLRPLRESDAVAVAACYRKAFGDERPLDAQTVIDWSRNTELKPEWLRVLELNGEVVGYGDIRIDDDEAELDLAAPGYWETFLEWGEDTGRAARVSRVRAVFPEGHELEGIVAARRYRYWRSAYTMQVEFGDTPPEAPSLPHGIELRGYDPSDAEALRDALNEAFARDPFFHAVTPESFRAFFLNARGFDPSLWLLAWADSELAGCLLAYPEFAGDSSLGSIQSLGVRPRWRRRGLGAALLRSAFCELHARGLRRVRLGVDAENETGAVRLYERVRDARRASPRQLGAGDLTALMFRASDAMDDEFGNY
jgi:ribosomal protein S18 acetylase RimI-like enzyme